MSPILEKIKKLLNMNTANGCTVEEAASAAKLAQKLLTEHKLSMTDLDEKEIIEDDVLEELGHKAITWRGQLAVNVSKANDCVVFVDTKYNPKKISYYRIVGKKSDMEVSKYFYTYLAGEIERLCAMAMREGKGTGKTYSNSFKLGAVAAISEKLRDATKDARSTATSSAIIRVDEEYANVKKFADDKFKLRSRGASYSSRDHGAYTDGKNAGKNISLNKGVGASSTRLLPG